MRFADNLPPFFWTMTYFALYVTTICIHTCVWGISSQQRFSIPTFECVFENVAWCVCVLVVRDHDVGLGPSKLCKKRVGRNMWRKGFFSAFTILFFWNGERNSCDVTFYPSKILFHGRSNRDMPVSFSRELIHWPL